MSAFLFFVMFIEWLGSKVLRALSASLRLCVKNPQRPAVDRAFDSHGAE